MKGNVRLLSQMAARRTGKRCFAYDATQEALLDNDQLILVNQNDDYIGMASKRAGHGRTAIDRDEMLHRAFSVFLFNSEGKLLLTQRSEDKILFPLRWTNTCCSHPLIEHMENDDTIEGKIYGVQKAAQVRMEYELGIPRTTFQPEEFHPLVRILYKAGLDDKWGEYEMDYVLFCHGDVELNYSPNEVKECVYVTQEELIRDYVNSPNHVLSPWFKLLVERSLPQWWSDLDNILGGKQPFDEKIHNWL